jgi:hypothetical protein
MVIGAVAYPVFAMNITIVNKESDTANFKPAIWPIRKAIDPRNMTTCTKSCGPSSLNRESITLPVRYGVTCSSLSQQVWP